MKANIIPENDLERLIPLAAAFLVLAALIYFTYLHNDGQTAFIRPQFELGKAAEYDLLTDREIVYVDTRATREKERQLGEFFVPIFSFQPNVSIEDAARYERFMLAVKNFRFTGDGGAGEATGQEYLPREEFRFFLDQLKGRNVLDRFRGLREELAARGVFHFPENFLAEHPKGLIELARPGAPGGELIHIDGVITRAKLKDSLRAAVQNESWSFEELQAMALLAYLFIRENVFLDERATAEKRAQQVSKHEPVFRILPKGFLIVKKGQLVTEDDLAKVSVFFATADDASPPNLPGRLVYLGVIAGLCLLVFRRPILERSLNRNQAIILAILDTMFLALTLILHRFLLFMNSVPLGVALPGGLVAVLATILISPRVGLINAAVITLGQLLVMDVQPSSLAFTFVGSAMGITLARKVERRIELARGGLFLAGIQALLAIGLGLLDIRNLFMTATSGLYALVNGLLTGPLTLGLLPLMEHAFNVPTTFRLLELSDVNSPMLKKMLGQAPGTYNHSVSVANLAENACRKIGANALLARVGAYYHDIGKIDQSEYFIENQTQRNKLDELSPGEASAIIRSHLRFGIEQAKKLGLPSEVVDIIAQHHGDGLISVFYQRALEDDPVVSRGDYSYPGRPPVSKEAAIVLLADNIEAAARSLKTPTIENLELLVNRLVLERLEAGSLRDCELSMRDLELIKSSFVKVLAGYYHSRIDYPSRQELKELEGRREARVE